MISRSSPSSLISVPDHLPNRMRSPTLTSSGCNWPLIVARAGAGGEDLAFLRLLLGGVGDDDAAGGLFLGLDAADQDTVMQWTKRHVVLLVDKQIFESSLRAASKRIRRGARDPFGIARKSIWFLVFRVSRGLRENFSTRPMRVLAR